MSNEYFIEDSVNTERGIPFKLCLQHFEKKKQFTIMAHMHNDIELLYVLKGDFVAYLNGARHEFSNGDLLVINSCEVHAIFSDNFDESEYIMCRFELGNLRMSGHKSDINKYVLPFMINLPFQPKIFKRADLEKYDVHKCIIEALDEYNSERFGYELAVKANILKVLVAVLRIRGLWDSENSDLFSNRINDITKAFEYIDKNFASNITMENVADRCLMSYSYFSRMFKGITKLNFSQYLLSVRLREAEYILATTDMPITEVAFGCGFSSSSYFVSKFREQKGITPKQYRNMMQKK
ncbi:MAG: AraC family transcriptional regulator [Clostridia bacterium]|nr:AraC family transcriptional regulator [Clostridia bacterium]